MACADVAAAKAKAAKAINLIIRVFLMIGGCSSLSTATSDHIFGQALPIMDSKAALASSIVAYLPSSLYLAFWVEESSLPGMTRHCFVVLSSTT
jgi:hypothetical protein